MPYQYFALLSTEAGYAAALTALKSLTDAKVNFTTTQTVRTAAHDASLEIIKANVTEAELNADPDLVDLRTANYPTALCRERWVDLADFRLRGFHTLGESVRSGEGAAGRDARYVRLLRSGGYGNGDGATYFDAFNGIRDPQINAGTDNTHQSATTYWYCGEIYDKYDALAPGKSKFNFSEILVERLGVSGNADATVIRGDYPNDPCLAYVYATWRDAGQELAWEAYSPGVYVQGDFNAETGVSLEAPEFGAPTYCLVAGQSGQARWTTTQLVQRAILEKKDAIADLQAAGETYHILGGGLEARANFAQVWQYDASLDSYVDETADANSAATADWNPFPASPEVGDIVYLGFASLFSGFEYIAATQGAGAYTIAWEYWNGAWVSPGAIVDNTDNLKAAGTNHLHFNPKADWAARSVNGSASLFYIRGVLQAGTMTTAPVGDQGGVKQSAMFVRLWDDSDPTGKQILKPAHGLRWVWSSGGVAATRVGQMELVNLSCINAGAVAKQLTPSNAFSAEGVGDHPKVLKVKGGRYIWNTDSWFHFGTGDEFFIGRSTDGRVEWDTSDRPDPATDECILALKSPRDASVAAAPATVFQNPERLPELAYQPNGLYFNTSGHADTEAGTVTLATVQGYYAHNTGRIRKGLDGNTGEPDMHALALRGEKPETQWNWSDIYIDTASALFVIYQSATGDGGLAPIQGTSAEFNNFDCRHVVLRNLIDVEGTEPESPNAGTIGFHLTGDNDQYEYEDGTGKLTNVVVDKLVIADIRHGILPGDTLYSNPAVPRGGTGVRVERDQQHVQPSNVQVLRCNHVTGSDRSGNTEALNVVTEDNSAATFNDVTAAIIGDTATAIFADPSGTDDAVYFGRKRDSFRRIGLNIVAAAAGTYTLAFEYWNGSAWTALSNVSDGSTNFTLTGARTITFDRPADWAATTVDGKNYFWMRVRLATGSFTVVPTTDLAEGPQVGYWMDIPDNWYFEDIDHYIFPSRSGTFSGGTHTVGIGRIKGKLKPGETLATKKFARFGSNGG